MRTSHVLIVEDNATLSEQLKRILEKDRRIKTRVVASGFAALRIAAERPPDAAVVDQSLPDLDGTELCRVLRSRRNTRHLPVIIVSDRASEADRLAGFVAGADDYVTKPFSLRELQARVNVVLRRGQQAFRASGSSVYRSRYLHASFSDGVVAVNGRLVDLTPREFELLWYLVDHRDTVLSGERLLRLVWDDVTLGGDTRTVGTHISRLRAKLGSAGKHIETLHNRGYRFNHRRFAHHPTRIPVVHERPE